MFKFASKSAGQSRLDLPPINIRQAPREAAHRDLLDKISNFLLQHDPDVNPVNLALAQEIVSGRNPGLSRQIVARQLASEPITQSWLDGLTSDGASGSTFTALLQIGICAARAARQPLAVAFCNIDRLTAINDSHGRDTGDRVIQAVARLLQRISGENCHVGRNGDENFAVLFRGLTPQQAAGRLNHARENFARRKLIDRQTRSAIGYVTFSGGVADVFAYDEPNAALTLADKALTTAKKQGGNRVVVGCKSATSGEP